MGTLGFIFFFGLLWVILNNHTRLPWWGVFLISLGAGLVCGFLCGFFSFVGLFFMGFGVGICIASIVLGTPFGTKVLTNYWGHFGILLGSGLVIACLALIFPRLISVIGTSIIGSFMMMNSIDIIWTKTGILFNAIGEMLSGKIVIPIDANSNWQYYVGLLITFGAVALIGSLIQFLITARNWTHNAGSTGKSGYEKIN